MMFFVSSSHVESSRRPTDSRLPQASRTRLLWQQLGENRLGRHPSSRKPLTLIGMKASICKDPRELVLNEEARRTDLLTCRRANEESILAIQIFDQKKFKKKDQGFLGVINVRIGSVMDMEIGGDGMALQLMHGFAGI